MPREGFGPCVCFLTIRNQTCNTFHSVAALWDSMLLDSGGSVSTVPQISTTQRERSLTLLNNEHCTRFMGSGQGSPVAEGRGCMTLGSLDKGTATRGIRTAIPETADRSRAQGCPSSAAFIAYPRWCQLTAKAKTGGGLTIVCSTAELSSRDGMCGV